MNIQKLIIPAILSLSLFTVIFTGCTSPTADVDILKTTAIQVQQAVQKQLDKLDADMSAAAASLGEVGLVGEQARQILNQLYQRNDFIVDCSATDLNGKMVTIAPDEYSSYEGTDISQQGVTLEFNIDKKPMLSAVFTAVEGFNAVVLIHPIVSGQDGHIGSLSALFKPETLFGDAMESASIDGRIAISVMQIDGLTIYDSIGTDTGKNLLTNPEFQPYTELVLLGHKIAVEDTGSGSYTYTARAGGQDNKKNAYWVSAGLHGTDWRVVAISEFAD